MLKGMKLQAVKKWMYDNAEKVEKYYTTEKIDREEDEEPYKIKFVVKGSNGYQKAIGEWGHKDPHCGNPYYMGELRIMKANIANLVENSIIDRETATLLNPYLGGQNNVNH